jgi:tetratricopeptide (TPR) repeat protein
MLKQQVRRIKKVLIILLAVLFAVSFASVAVSTANNTNISAIAQNNGLHIIDLDFVAEEGAHVIYKYIGDYNGNYTQHVEYILKGEHLVEDIRIASGVDYDNVTVNGKRVDLDSLEAYDRNIAYTDAARYQEQLDEAKMDADLNNTYESDIKIQDEALRIDLQNESAWTNKGLALYNLTKYDEAITAYDKAIGINPRNSKAWTNKGLALYSLNKYDEELAAYNKAIEINPQDIDAWTHKGLALYSLNKYDEALASYDKAIEINPKDEDAWYFKGNALRDLGKYDEAQKAYDKAFKRS